jgi:diacylglycerol kinase (CTP)
MYGSQIGSSQAYIFNLPGPSRPTDLHLARKAWHVLMGLFILAVYFLFNFNPMEGSFALALAFLVFYTSEKIRLRNQDFNQWILWVFGPLMRKDETRKMSGIPAYLAAASLAFLIFPQDIAVWSILLLVFGDPAASLVGIAWGKKSVRFSNGKSLLGTLAGIFVSALVSMIYLSVLGYSAGFILLGSLLGGLAGGLTELIPMPFSLKIDDNFLIPMVSGFVLSLLYLAWF